MIDENNLEHRLEQLGNSMTPDSAFTQNVMDRISKKRIIPIRYSRIRKLSVNLFNPRWIMVSACTMVFAILWFWSPSDTSHPGDISWWLGTSSVYAQEITSKLKQARVKGIIARYRTTFVMEDDSKHISSTVQTLFILKDRRRNNIYNEGELTEIQWYIPEGDKLVQTGYRIKDDSIHIDHHELGKSIPDMISHITSVVQLIDKSKRQFEPKKIDGIQCIGFEVESNIVDSKSKNGTYTVWFDTKTKLPVKVMYDRPIPANKNHQIKRMISTYDHFEWNPHFAENLFVPQPAKNTNSPSGK
jgi:outer membrane lipoprotein-sorting protein